MLLKEPYIHASGGDGDDLQSGGTFENKATKDMLYIDALGKDRCANVYRIQFLIPKADSNGLIMSMIVSERHS